MYPYLKLAFTLLRARLSAQLEPDETAALRSWVGILDTDPFLELNHARHLTYMEMGRWDYGIRSGFGPLMRRNNWGFTVGGISIRYRRRVPFLKPFTITTKPLCHDSRWFYFLQEITCKQKICSSALVKAGVVSADGLVPATEILGALDQAEWGHEVPDWVEAWIQAEGMRPWPGKA